ncbi:MAG: winged helix-turn-helix transcriptional regulator [Hyphomicrobiales bacterium]|nr:winged helix-turn-helix transcriptional regulator [Hyphomicrobiales bacterium]
MNMDELAARASDAESMLKALANRSRLMVLCGLYGQERSVNELCDMLGLNQPTLSQHLARLRADGLVHTRRDAQKVLYSLGGAPVERMIGLLHEMFCAADCAAPGLDAKPEERAEK